MDQYKDLEYYPNRFCKCGCGGRIKVKPHHSWCGIPDYICGHNMRGKGRVLGSGRKKLPREIRTCVAPGCDNTFEVIVTSTRKFCCRGHSGKGKSISKERIEKIKKALKGKTHVEIHGLVRAEEMRKANSEAHKGVNSSNKRPEVRLGCSIRMKELWQDPDYVAMQMKARGVKPNKPEKFLDELFQKLFPNQWKYVGDGEFILAGRCPDFIDVNGQKKIIELYGDYWHRNDNPQERIDLFAKYGYQTLVIWEHELEDMDKLEVKVVSFSEFS